VSIFPLLWDQYMQNKQGRTHDLAWVLIPPVREWDYLREDRRSCKRRTKKKRIHALKHHTSVNYVGSVADNSNRNDTGVHTRGSVYVKSKITPAWLCNNKQLPKFIRRTRSSVLSPTCLLRTLKD